MQNTIEIGRQAFAEIQKHFPHLKMIPDEKVPVEISIDMPVQTGLKYKVNLNLQNTDELHLSISNFWLEWFPCTRTERVSEYIQSVCGLLSGEYRIIEHYRGNKCIKAELQKPQDLGWKTVGTSSHLHFVWPWEKKHSSVIQNT